MNIKGVLAVTAFLWGVSVADATAADQRIDHYEAQSSESLQEALSNLQEYNETLQEILQKDELSQDDMVAVHELTYTLEVALERLRNDLGNAADTLEEVHVASETMEQDTVRKQGQRYLEVLNEVLN
jgi:phytoene dehydrogenase-like protein